MGMALCGMLFSQDCRLESPDGITFWLGQLLLNPPKNVEGRHCAMFGVNG
jgi:hypothetical protein